MPRIFNDFVIVADQSGSSTPSNDVIHFVYQSSSYNDILTSGSLAKIQLNTLEATDKGARGELLFIISDNDLTGSGEPVMRLFHTGSTNEPRVGIGFNVGEPITKALEIKSKKDSAEGTDLILEGSRITQGAEVGDEAGKISFIINSGSYDSKFTSGSIASIKGVVKGVSDVGAQGRIVMAVGKSNTEEPTNVWGLGYQDGTTGGELPNSLGIAMVLSGSVQLVDFSPGLESSYSLLDSDNTPTFVVKNVNGTQGVASLYLTGSITGSNITTDTIFNVETTLATDDITNIDTFATATYKGAIYDYILYDAGVGARTGQFMVIQDNSVIEFTDTSTPTIGPEDSIPSITADIDGALVRVRITNGNGYTFKAFTKKL